MKSVLSYLVRAIACCSYLAGAIYLLIGGFNPSQPLPPDIEARLPYRQSSSTLALEKFSTLREALADHRFTWLEQYLDNLHVEYKNDYHQDERIVQVWDVITEVESGKHLVAWRERRPNSAIPFLASSRYHYHRAWDERGGGSYSTLSKNQKNGFRQESKQALLYFAKARDLGASGLMTALMRVNVSRDMNGAREYHKTALEELELYPDSIYLARLAVSSFLPQWRGSYKEMYELATERARESRNPAMVTLFGAIYREVARRKAVDQEYQQAVDWMDKAIATGDSKDWYYLRAGYKQKLGDLPGAIADIEDELKNFASSSKALVRYAHYTALSGQLETSKRAFLKAGVVDSPSDRNSRGNWQDWAAQKIAFKASDHFRNDIPGAIEIYNRALAISPQHIFSLYWRAEAKRQIGDAEGAEAGFRRVAAIDPTHIEARRGIDEVLLPQRRLVEIIDSWSDLLSYSPDNAEALFERSGTYYHAGKKELSRIDISRACELGHARACETKARYYGS